MREDNFEKWEVIMPGEPGYDKLGSIDSSGSGPVSTVAMLRFTESELRKLQKMKEQGAKNTLPELPDDNDTVAEPMPIDKRIAELEKMVADTKELIDWAEAKEPGLSKKANGSLPLYEFLKEQAAKNHTLSTITEQQKLDFVRSLTVNFKKIDQNLNYVDSLNAFYRNDSYADPYMAIVEIAYTTLRRNVRGINKHPNKDAIYNEAKPFLRKEIMHLTAETEDEFDAWHRKTVERLIDIFAKNGYENFTVGEAQKWINMSLKHLSIFNPYMTIACYGFLHIPIDNKILAGLKSPVAPQSLKDIDCSFGQDSKKVASWSTINDYDAYMKFQKEIREKCGEIPLDFEFKFWPKA
ncbi:hypothetical protein IKF76_00660 [Candidatus Saccharibacteria bacterium]|nr:hypothetical protein [Candidatus Saccharibacteria bacterium]